MDDRSLPAHTKATVGMRVTKEVGTDCYAGVCTAIDRDGKRATFTVGNRKYQCSLRSDGRYREVGRSSKETWVRWALGVAENRLDPHF